MIDISSIILNYKLQETDIETEQLGAESYLITAKEKKYLLRKNISQQNQENFFKTIQYISKKNLATQNLILNNSQEIFEYKGFFYCLSELDNSIKVTKKIFVKSKILEMLDEVTTLINTTQVVRPLLQNLVNTTDDFIQNRLTTIKNNLDNGFEKLRLLKDYSAAIDKDFFELLINNLNKYFDHKKLNRDLDGLNIDFVGENFYIQDSKIKYFLSENINTNGYLWTYANLFRTIIGSKSEDIDIVYKIFSNYLESKFGSSANLYFSVIADLTLVQYVYLNLSGHNTHHERAIFNIIRFLNSRNIFKWV